MMRQTPEVAVTLTPQLYDRLTDEARLTGIPLEWLVASLVVDTMDMPTEALRSR